MNNSIQCLNLPKTGFTINDVEKALGGGNDYQIMKRAEKMLQAARKAGLIKYSKKQWHFVEAAA